MKTNPKPRFYGPNWQGQRCEARTSGWDIVPASRQCSLWGAGTRSHHLRTSAGRRRTSLYGEVHK